MYHKGSVMKAWDQKQTCCRTKKEIGIAMRKEVTAWIGWENAFLIWIAWLNAYFWNLKSSAHSTGPVWNEEAAPVGKKTP